MTKLILTLTPNDPHDDAQPKCRNVSRPRSSIDENNENVSRSWIVFRNGIVAKLTSAEEFSAAEELVYIDSPVLSWNAKKWL